MLNYNFDDVELKTQKNILLSSSSLHFKKVYIYKTTYKDESNQQLKTQRMKSKRKIGFKKCKQLI